MNTLTATHDAVLAAAGHSAGEAVTFWLLAVVAVAAAIGMVLSRRAVRCAMMLAVAMLSLAVLYAVQDAPFLAFVQVIVYTGAVLMLFLFVLMLVGVSTSDSLVETIRGQRLLAAAAGIAFVALVVVGIAHATLGPTVGLTGANQGGNLQALARLIFTRYVFAFEVTSALLITAAIGAMVMAHRERTAPRPTQKELSRQRVRGPHPTPLPGPGVYARHNAIDMPALLPDGTPSPLSVNPVIARRQEMQGRRPEVPRDDVAEVAEIAERGVAEPVEVTKGDAEANHWERAVETHSAVEVTKGDAE